MQKLKLLLAAIITTGFLLGCHTARAIEPLFEDETEQSDDTAFEETVSHPQDAIGRVEAIDGTQWTKGADGHYRSDGDDCVFSKPVNRYICTK